MSKWLVACLLGVALCAASGGRHATDESARFDQKRTEQDPRLEATWPPIDNASFRSALLDILFRNNTLRELPASLRDVTLNTDAPRFCDMSPGDRGRLTRLEFSRVTEAFYRQEMVFLHANCGMRIFAAERHGRQLFVAIYGRRRHPPAVEGQVFTTRHDNHILKVVAVPVLATDRAAFDAAAQARAQEIARALW
jgi:hypothetical protein